MKRIFNDVYFYFVIILTITFVIIKIPHLFLPFYWDEAFGHSLSARYLFENGLGILPGSMPPDVSKGHPLLFFFCEALWMKLFGDSIFAMKLYPLLLSVLLLFVIYFFCKKFFNRLIGVVACIIFASQEIFIAQSSFVLFEVQLTLLTMISLYLYFSKRWVLYIISASMLVLTKESGIVLVFTLILWRIIEYVFLKEKAPLKIIIKNLTLLLIPLFVFTIYIIIQKFTYGWFLYPGHTKYITFNLNTFYKQMFDGYSAYLFIYYGRNLMTFFIIVSIIFIIIKHYKITSIEKNIISVFSIFILLFLIFSSLNFYSNRYILCIFPVFIILFSFLIIKAFNKYKLILALLLIIIVSIKIYFSFTKLNSSDYNIGFANAVIVHKNVVEYCEQNKWQDKNIYTHFLLQQDLLNPDLGYLTNKNIVFKHVSNSEKDFDKSEYFIFSNVEYNPLYDNIKKLYKLKLIKRFEKNNAWSEIYEVIK